MLRVTHIISGIDPQNGGPTIALLGMAKAQRRAGIDARVVCTWREASGPANAGIFHDAGVPLRMLGRARGPLSWHPGIPRMMDEVIAASDVVHVHAVWEQVQHVAMARCRARGMPFVFTPHGMLSEWNMRQGTTRKKLFLAWRLRADIDAAVAIHFTTVAERDSTAPLGLKPTPLIETLGIDLEEFVPPPGKGALRRKYPQIGGRKVVLFLGRIDPKKGLDLLVPAFAEATGHEEAVLVLVGPDSDGYGTEVRRLAREKGVEDRVIFTGLIKGRERLELLADADLFAMTSYIENFGVSVVEALAAGVPLLLSDQVQVGEFLKDGAGAVDVGAIVPVEVGAIAREMRRWLGDDGLRARAAARAPAVAHERFDWLAVAKRWEAHYRGAMGRGAMGRGAMGAATSAGAGR